MWSTRNLIFGSVFIFLALAFEFIEICSTEAETTLRSEPVFWICYSFLVYYFPNAVIASSYSCFSIDFDLSKTFSVAHFLTQKSLGCFIPPFCPIRLYVG